MRLDEKTGLKKCPRCGKEKRETGFAGNKGTIDGLSIYCKKCNKEYQNERNKTRKIRDPMLDKFSTQVDIYDELPRNEEKQIVHWTTAKDQSEKEIEVSSLYDELINDEEFRSLLINLGK